MKIYINGRFLTQRITGVQRYAREVVMALDKLFIEELPEDEWLLLTPHGANNDLSLLNIKVKQCGNFHGHLWEQVELPFFSRDGILLNLCNCAPMIKRRQLMVIHDGAVAAYPSAYSWQFRYWYRIMHTICGKITKKIVTDSQFSKNEISNYFSINKNKITVIYAGIDHMDRIKSDDSVIDELGLNGEKFVLAVSSQNPTKNFSLVLKAAYLLPTIKFVIAGGTNSAVFSSENIKQSNNVQFAGYVSDEKLVSLYSHASVFVYPSLYEGFGFPPLEALSKGCQSIVSDCASLPEVCGDYVHYCNAKDEHSMVNKIKDVMTENNYSLHIEKVKEQMKAKYSWEKTAKSLLKLIRDS